MQRASVLEALFFARYHSRSLRGKITDFSETPMFYVKPLFFLF
jgi:hypothetical protein